ncbi:MAG: alpha/beta hydrolase [Acidobacteriota bacterium]
MRVLLAFAVATICAAQARQPFYDRTHPSKVFGEDRHYRILLPADYETSAKRYPVIYYFHGHSDRYTVEKYDNGTDTIPKMAEWVAKHDAIVVCVDGYVAEHYQGFYGGYPYDVLEDGGKYDFGAYFLELVDHIDRTYRTLTDRRHRATSGLSMGGFMSLYLSARYPDWIGSASAFNPGPEFFTGDPGRRVLWRPKDHVPVHAQTMVRLIRASGDYISQYHEETRDAYARAGAVDFEFRQDEYHRHWATSIGETFDFHARAFANPALDNVPQIWNYASAYRTFEARGYRVAVEAAGAGFTYLEGVRQGGLRVTTRRWAPDGPPLDNAAIRIATAPLYKPAQTYRVNDYSLATRKTRTTTATADAEGRLSFTVDGGGHQIGIAGAGTGAQPPVLLPVTEKDKLRIAPQTDFALPVRIFNPRGAAMKDIRVSLSSEYPTVRIVSGEAAIPEIQPGAAADLTGKLIARFTSGAGFFAPARLVLKLACGGLEESEDIDVLVAPEVLEAPAEYEILDGRTKTFSVFRQKGNQGGGGPVERTVTEGRGNGNGILEPGEEATIWVRMPQGMDPFDKGNWYRTKIYSDSPWIEEVRDIEEQKQLEWTGAKERTSVIRLAPGAPAGTQIPLLLANETWSYTFTPDVRYGKERLYQAFQLHTNHLHRLTLGAGR